MTVFTTILAPSDIHDSRFHNPSNLCSTIQYQIPPSSYFTLYQMQQYINDLSLLPYKTRANSILSFDISNTSLSSYKNSRLLKQHLDILWDNCKVERINLDFTQFKFRDGILQRTFALVNHIQKHGNYNIFLSITLPVNKDLKISDEFISLLLKFQDEFININMLNILITKDLKRKNISWLELTKLTYQNIVTQLKLFDSTNNIFIGKIEKYIGFVFDCDISPSTINYNINNIDNLLIPSENNSPLSTTTNSNNNNNNNNSRLLRHSHSHSFLRHRDKSAVSSVTSSVKSSVKQSVIHGEKKNMFELDFLKIWKWANDNSIGQIQIKSYLTNSKNIKKFIEKNKSALSYNPHHDPLNNILILPKDLLFILADEVGIKNITDDYYEDSLPFSYVSILKLPQSTRSISTSSSSSTSTQNSLDTLKTTQSKSNGLNYSIKIMSDNNNNSNKNNVDDINDSDLPDYDTVMLQKVMENERMMNTLVKLPSYRTTQIN